MNGTKFCPGAEFKPGFIANAKIGELFNCTLGGAKWSATNPHPNLGSPTLLVTVNLRSLPSDLEPQSGPDLEIPLMTHINLDGIMPTQEYQLDHHSKTAAFSAFTSHNKLTPSDQRLQTPLPESILRLREMEKSEIPVDEQSYWTAIDSFLGGQGAIRICGSPLYIDYIPSVQDGMRYFASIGYESMGLPSAIRDDQPFFVGEVAYYFFVSADWRTVRVVSQAC